MKKKEIRKFLLEMISDCETKLQRDGYSEKERDVLNGKKQAFETVFSHMTEHFQFVGTVRTTPSDSDKKNLDEPI